MRPPTWSLNLLGLPPLGWQIWKHHSTLKRLLNSVEICKRLDEKGLTKSEANPLWIW